MLPKTQSRFLRIAAEIFIIAVLLNYGWEVAQSPLYVDMGNLHYALIHCFRSSCADGLIVLILFGVGCFIFGDLTWYRRPKLRGYAMLLVTGLLLGVLIEWLGVQVLHRWSYEKRMPVVPVINLGIVPIAQMLVLPPIIFKLAATWNGLRNPRA